MKFSHAWRQYKKTVLALFLCWSVSQAQAVDIMPVSQIKPGMEGIGKTVVQGDTLSTFKVKVIGVVKKNGSTGDLILVKYSGPVIEQSGGIVHGMSGSPVYIDGKLIGAVAFGWSNTDGDLGELTPAEEMLKLFNISDEKQIPIPWQKDELVPLTSPLMANGFDDTSLSYLQEKLPGHHFAFQNTAMAADDSKVKPLVDGGSVAALLVDGDLKMGYIGTVTYTDGKQMVGFGHPVLKRGAVEYFMNNSYIFTVVRSRVSGFKLGSMGAEVGKIVQDRSAGIAGIVGEYAGGVPIRFDIRDLDTGDNVTAKVKVIDDKEMTAPLAATSLYTFLNKTTDRIGEGTASVTYTITPKGDKYEPLTRQAMVYSASSVNAKGVEDFYDVTDALLNNRFEDYEILAIDVKADVTKEPRTATIEDALASPVILAPGDTVAVKVKLKPYRADSTGRTVFYTVPKDKPFGKYMLEVRGGSVVPLPYLLEKQKYNLTDEILRRLKKYKDFKEFYEELQEQDRANQLVVEILENNVSMVDDGDNREKVVPVEVEKPKVPADVTKVTKGKDVADFGGVDDKNKPDKARVDTPYIIRGDGQISITITSPAQRDKMLAKLAKEKGTISKKAEMTKSDDGNPSTVENSNNKTVTDKK